MKKFVIRKQVLTFLLLVVTTSSAWCELISDPLKTLTIDAPKGWTSTTDGDSLVLVAPGETASLVVGSRGPIPLKDSSQIKSIIEALAADGWKVTKQAPASISGVPAIKVDIDGTSGDVAGDRGFFYLVSDENRGWLIFGLATKKDASRVLPSLDSAVRNMRLVR